MVGKRFDWETSNKRRKPTRNIKDENEWLETDRAARWLQKRESANGAKKLMPVATRNDR